MRVDAVFPEQMVAVEIDGGEGHRTPRQLDRDHRPDQLLRTLGYIVLRYSAAQIREDGRSVVAEIRAMCSRCAAAGGESVGGTHEPPQLGTATVAR